MSTRLSIISMLAVTLLSNTPPTFAQAQVNQGVLAQQLLAEDGATARAAMHDAVRALTPEKMGPVLRAALITTLDRQNGAFEVYEAMMDSGVVDGIEDPAAFPPEMQAFWGEDYRFLIETVISLRDPPAIPALTAAVGNANIVHTALAEFGEQAAPALLDVLEGEEKAGFPATMALKALTLMIEEPIGPPLTQSTLGRAKRLVQQQLTTHVDAFSAESENSPFTTSRRLGAAVSFALALGDPPLREVVFTLSRDPEAVRRLGLSDPALIETVRSHAREALSRTPIRR